MFIFYLIWNFIAITSYGDVYFMFFVMFLVGFGTGCGFVNIYYYLYEDKSIEKSEKELCTILSDVSS